MAAQRSLAYAACLALLYLLPAVAAVATNSKAHLPPHQLLALARVGQHAWWLCPRHVCRPRHPRVHSNPTPGAAHRLHLTALSSCGHIRMDAPTLVPRAARCDSCGAQRSICLPPPRMTQAAWRSRGSRRSTVRAWRCSSPTWSSFTSTRRQTRRPHPVSRWLVGLCGHAKRHPTHSLTARLLVCKLTAVTSFVK
jgi:hypothetical protein